jgi:hypothetical protein
MIAAIVIGFFKYKDRWSDPGSSWLKNFVLRAHPDGHLDRGRVLRDQHGGPAQAAEKVQRQQTAQPVPIRAAPPPSATPARTAHFEWPLVLGIGGLVLLAAIWMYVRGRRRLAPLYEERGLEADMVTAIESTHRRPARETDARRAVIAAYAVWSARSRARPRAAPLRGTARVPRHILRGLHVRERPSSA